MERNEGGDELLLSNDLVIEILIRADAKTIFKSKCVSKGWETLISEQSFINRYIKRSLPPVVTGFFICSTGKITDSDGGKSNFINICSSGEDVVVVEQPLSFISSVKGQQLIIVDSNNGLLLCADKKPSKCSYYVCNPFTKHWIALPEPRRCTNMESALLYCYNNTDEFCAQKIEFMVLCFIKDSLHFTEIEIFCSKTGEWKEPKKHNDVSYDGLFKCITLYNGCAYWLQANKRIVIYDLKEDSLRSLEFPGILRSTSRSLAHLGVSAGSLYVIEIFRMRFYVWSLVDGVEFRLKHRIEMKSFQDHPGNTNLFCPKLLPYHPTNNRLLLGYSSSKCALYRISRGKMRLLKLINDLDPSILCDHELKLFPYSLPAWPTCIPLIKNNI